MKILQKILIVFWVVMITYKFALIPLKQKLEPTLGEFLLYTLGIFMFIVLGYVLAYIVHHLFQHPAHTLKKWLIKRHDEYIWRSIHKESARLGNCLYKKILSSPDGKVIFEGCMCTLNEDGYIVMEALTDPHQQKQ